MLVPLFLVDDAVAVEVGPGKRGDHVLEATAWQASLLLKLQNI
jgi:hypothetical protein